MDFFKENQFWCIILGIVILMIIHHLISKDSIIEGVAEMSIKVVNHIGDKGTEEKDTDELAPVIDPNKLSEMDRELEEREVAAADAATGVAAAATGVDANGVGAGGAVADGTVVGAVADAVADGTVVGAVADGTVAGAVADGTVAGAVADGTVAGAVADGTVVGANAGANDGSGDSSSQVIRLNTGTCENPITTNEECIAAATALGLDPPMWGSSPGLNTNYPNGCSIPYGTKAFFNIRTGVGVECGGGAADADCICASANANANANAGADANAVENDDSCENTPNWTDGTNGCDVYERNDGWCDTYGGNNYPNGNANENCCVCGGGVRDDDPQEVSGVLENCIGGASYIGPNTDPGKQDASDFSGCGAYNHNASTKEKCNTSYQMDINGNYTQCELDTNDNTCKPKTVNCNPEMSVNGLPFCKRATWIPHSSAVFDCECEENLTPGKEHYKVNKWKGSTRCMERDANPIYHITDCGIEGADPPTTEECSSELSSNPWFNDENMYSYLNGIHTLNLQEGNYLIEIAGAIGGQPNGNTDFIRGKGSIMRGIIHLREGAYKVLVGQKGIKNLGGNGCNYGGGGGGGSFFWMDGAPQPLLVAGGGGGAGGGGTQGMNCGAGEAALNGFGGDASLSGDGSMAPLYPNTPGGNPTLDASKNSFGTGGANGSMSNGGLNASYVSKGWNSIKTGTLSNIKGVKSSPRSYNGVSFTPEGGFGGGGLSSSHAGGGGGGYSGGGVVNWGGDFKTVGGGGGGSMYNTNFSHRESSAILGYNDGGGYIKIWGPY